MLFLFIYLIWLVSYCIMVQPTGLGLLILMIMSTFWVFIMDSILGYGSRGEPY